MMNKASESPWQEVRLVPTHQLSHRGRQDSCLPSPCPKLVCHLQNVVHLSQCCLSVTISTPSAISSVFSTPLATSRPPPPSPSPHHGYCFNHLFTNTASATSYFHQSSITSTVFLTLSITSSMILRCWPQASPPELSLLPALLPLPQPRLLLPLPPFCASS